jgi:hypothetical protein
MTLSQIIYNNNSQWHNKYDFYLMNPSRVKHQLGHLQVDPSSFYNDLYYLRQSLEYEFRDN